MSTPLKLETVELEGSSGALRELSHSTSQLSTTLSSAWGQLDGGWHSYCREDANGYFRHVMTELKHMEDMLAQMGTALNGTAGLVGAADVEAATYFLIHGENSNVPLDENGKPVTILLPEVGGTSGEADQGPNPPPTKEQIYLEPFKYDEQEKDTLKRLQCDFLASARRQNNIPGMSDEDYAALIAAIITGERRITTPRTEAEKARRQIEDDVVRGRYPPVIGPLLYPKGFIVSGRLLEQAKTKYDETGDVIALLNTLNAYYSLEGVSVDNLATVGIGNMWIKTAVSMWKGEACNPWNECVPVSTSPLTTTQPFLWWSNDVPIENPFANGATDQEAWRTIATQLLDEKTNIEYISANIHMGMERAKALGLTPSALLAGMWHTGGVLTPGEVARSIADSKLFNKDPTGHAALMAAWQKEARAMMDFSNC